MSGGLRIPSRDRVECFDQTSERFLRELFDLNADDALLTDESSLSDFFPRGLAVEAIEGGGTLGGLYEARDVWVLGEV